MKQGDNLVIHCKDKWQNFELERLPRLRFERDWAGKAPLPTTEFVLAAEDGLLHFLFWCHQKPFYDPAERDNLWHYDVAELFFSHNEIAGYGEINLAPSGALWWQTFSHVRSKGVGGPSWFIFEKAQNRAQVYSDQWSLHFELALREPITEELCLNVTAIVHHQGERQYLTWLNLAALEPDFHRPAEFLPVRLKNY